MDSRRTRHARIAKDAVRASLGLLAYTGKASRQTAARPDPDRA
jgi:hypothetical protein